MNRHKAPIVNGENVVHDEQTDRYLLHEPSLLRSVLTSQASRVGSVALMKFAAYSTVTYELLALKGAHIWESPGHDLQNAAHFAGRLASTLLSIGGHL